MQDSGSISPHPSAPQSVPFVPQMRGAWHLDHLVYACRDLDRAVAAAEEILGVQAVAGGRHPGKGTMNALIGLGSRMYLEIVGADPEQAVPEEGRWFRVDALESPRLVTWCATGGSLSGVQEAARSAGLELGAISAGGRRRPDGTELHWEVTDPGTPREGGVIPFFIHWRDSPHPALDLPGGCELVELRAEHPHPARVRDQAEALGLVLPLDEAPEPSLVARIRTERGMVEFR